jgi:hypothetical protein
MRILHIIVVLAAWCLFAGVAAAQTGDQSNIPPGGLVGVGTGVSIDVEIVTPRKIGGNSVFSVKFLCGEILPENESLAEGSPLAPGSYRTDINIHNPNPTVLGWGQKVVVATPQTLGPPTLLEPAVATSIRRNISADAAENIGCRVIRSILTGAFGDFPGGVHNSRFIKGFVVISVPKPPKGEKKLGALDVVGVYTLKNVDVVKPPPAPMCSDFGGECDNANPCCEGLVCTLDLVCEEFG